MTRTPQPHTFANQLGREWDSLRRRPTALAQARSWRSQLSPGTLRNVLDDLVDLEQIVDATNPTPSADAADAALVQLVEMAQHDQLAGRIVIHRLLPGLISRAARYRDRRDGVDPAELVVAAAWIAIREYDTDRRRHHVAASIISDATFQAFRRPLRRRSADEHAAPTAEFASRPAPPHSSTALEQLAAVIRTASQRGVPPTELQLVRDLVRVGSAHRLAAENGVTPRTIRNRRDRAVAHIREAVRAA